MPRELDVEISTGRVRAIQVTSTRLDPPSGLAAAPVVGGGTFAAGTYYWVITFEDDKGETTKSNEATATIALNGSADLTWDAPPQEVTHVKVYRGTATGAEDHLIATLGVVAAYTDTGTAGSAATPPTSNTASLDPVDIITSDGYLYGWSMRETTGTAGAVAELHDGDQVLGVMSPAANGESNMWFGPLGVKIANGISLVPVSGNVTGAVYASYYRA